MRSTSKLRELLKRPVITACAGCWDPLSAMLVEQQGFEAAYLSGSAVSGSMIGKNDFGYITQTEVVDCIRRITQAIKIPLVADADDGFGDPPEVQRTVRLYEQAGAAGLHIEDLGKPKRCAILSGGRLGPKDEMVRKVRAAVEARRDPDFVIIARTDNHEGIDEAIARGSAYAEAGADVVFIVGFASADDMRRARSRIAAPMMVVQSSGTKTPMLPLVELESLGYQMVIYAVQAYKIAYFAARDWYRELRQAVLVDKSQTPPAGLPPSTTFEIEEILGMEEDRRVQEEYLRQGQ